MKILIAGCGYLGTALGEKLVRLGDEVWGLRRDEEALKKNSEKGIQPFKADLLAPDTLKNLPSVDIAILCQGPSRKTDNHQTTYQRATANLIKAFQAVRPKKVIFISSTSVYSTHDGSWVNEDTDPMKAGYESKESEGNARCLLEAEKTVLSSGIPSTVFRLAGIYGPDRNRIRSLKEGRARPSFSEMYSNRIHRDDIVSGILLLMEKGNLEDIYIGADDCPSTLKEFYSWIYEELGLANRTAFRGEALEVEPDLLTSPHGTSFGKRCSNRKIKELGLDLRYPDFKKGYQELIRNTLPV